MRFEGSVTVYFKNTFTNQFETVTSYALQTSSGISTMTQNIYSASGTIHGFYGNVLFEGIEDDADCPSTRDRQECSTIF